MADEEDYSSLPLTERAVHKVWKVRQAAYDEMQKQFTSSGSESDGCFRPFLDNPGIIKKIVMDANVVAQETGVAAVCAFLEFGGSNACLKTRSAVVGSLAEKALGSSRAGTKRNAVDALLWYIELDTPDPVLEELVPFLTHRTPKLVVANTNAITEIIKAFGAKTVNMKPVIPVIPKLFAHADKNVRAEASTLVVELYKWLGDSFAALVLPNLKPVQQKELEQAFLNVKEETPHQQRYLKSQRDALERQQASGINTAESSGGPSGAGAGAADEDEDEEMPDLVDPVAVLSKVPADFDSRLGSTKWKDRKEALEELRTAFNVPKMENEDFGEIMRLLAKCMKDANVQVVIVAANCIEQVANGIKSNFHRYLSTVVSPMLERTKEKKANVMEALSSALDAVFKSTGLVISDVLESVLEYLKHKTPQVKIETAKFLVRCLSTTKQAPKQPELKEIAEAGVKLLSETQEPVRAGGQEILGVLMKIFGERPMNPFLDSIDDIKRKKINEYCENAQVKAKPEKPKSVAATPGGGATSRRQAAPGAAPSATSSATGRKIAAPKKPTPGLKTPRPQASTTTQAPLTAGKKRLAASPLKPGASRERTERFGDEPPVQSPTHTPQHQQHQQQLPRSALNRGLTGRSLTSAAQAQARAAPPPPDPKIAILEKEVEQLKLEKNELTKEKEQLQRKSQEEQSEKARLMQEINDLQLKNAQLVEDHTRDILAIKSKETQLVRAMSDADTARLRIQKLEHEVERLQAKADEASQGYGSNASSEPRSPPPAESKASHRNSTIRRSIDFSSGSHYGFKSRPVSLSDDKENSFASFKNARALYDTKDEQLEPHVEEDSAHHNDHDGDVAMDEAPTTATAPAPAHNHTNTTANRFQSHIPPPPTASNSGAPPQENWKRAVEVTTQLRARIEAMKARQNRARQ